MVRFYKKCNRKEIRASKTATAANFGGYYFTNGQVHFSYLAVVVLPVSREIGDAFRRSSETIFIMA